MKLDDIIIFLLLQKRIGIYGLSFRFFIIERKKFNKRKYKKEVDFHEIR